MTNQPVQTVADVDLVASDEITVSIAAARPATVTRSMDDSGGDAVRIAVDLPSDLAAVLSVPAWAVRGRVIDAAHLARQREFSLKTFGPGARTNGVIDHITKELVEVREAPDDLSEWVDVIILAFDGAWRSGAEPQEIIDAIIAKQAKNETREWPDWRSQDPNKAIEHDRSTDVDPLVELPMPPTCSMCQRERTLADAYDYNPLQIITGQPVGWYSGDDGEVCPQCMAKTLDIQLR
ncbi:hypothetical protein SEA_DMITRI_55 [Gordonia phage Dmitri]|nr:hypothetical protein SEA_DMITRI_55 [Gordonia phage Dmitri]